ncbi:hypothetical protein ACSQ67_017424 [Phaseolus vulgaris]
MVVRHRNGYVIKGVYWYRRPRRLVRMSMWSTILRMSYYEGRVSVEGARGSMPSTNAKSPNRQKSAVSRSHLRTKNPKNVEVGKNEASEEEGPRVRGFGEEEMLEQRECDFQTHCH